VNPLGSFSFFSDVNAKVRNMLPSTKKLNASRNIFRGDIETGEKCED